MTPVIPSQVLLHRWADGLRLSMLPIGASKQNPCITSGALCALALGMHSLREASTLPSGEVDDVTIWLLLVQKKVQSSEEPCVGNR